MRGYLSLFIRGWLLVFLVSLNSYQIPHLHYAGGGCVGFLISWLWFQNARSAGRPQIQWHAEIYALGAALGTLSGMALSAWWYGPAR